MKKIEYACQVRVVASTQKPFSNTMATKSNKQKNNNKNNRKKFVYDMV